MLKHEMVRYEEDGKTYVEAWVELKVFRKVFKILKIKREFT